MSGRSQIRLGRASFTTLALLSSALWPLAAAAVQQPDGTVVPVIISNTGACTSGLNVQACLDDSEVSLGGTAATVGAVANATINQETFDPGCQLTFKVLSKGGSRYGHAFGWYPVRPGNVPPPLSDLNVFLTCADAQTPGTTKTLTLPAGVTKVGFFMASYSSTCGALSATGALQTEPLYTFYTERRFNGLDRAGMPIADVPLNAIRVLTWQSAAEPGSFYFGWEDDGKFTDNNFNDLVTRVGGISCSGGGGSCSTGLPGACAAGSMQCRAGMLTCVPDQTPVAETCNAVDDNCDGTVDEGSAICPPQKVCYRGNCVPSCTQSEFYPCPLTFECDAATGICVESSCKSVTCATGQLCRGGQCRGECEGIVCPYGQACRHGGCVDVCGSLKCDTGFTCLVQPPKGADVNPVGVCSNCPCKGCPTGTTCSNNACIPSDCAAVTCSPGTHCQGGNCIDSCVGAKCPVGSACTKGQCVMDPGMRPDAGMGTTPPGGPGGAGAGSDAARSADAGVGGAAGTTAPSPNLKNVGCGCRMSDGAGGAAWVLILLALAGARRRWRGRQAGRGLRRSQ